jgi:protein associated with RNAse G/E
MMPEINNIEYTMKAYKYDGRLHYEQRLSYVSFRDKCLELRGSKGRKLHHYTRDDVYTFDKETLEYFFEDRWYTAALVFDDDGNVVHVYCNIAYPARINQDIVSFIDLDVDVVVIDGRIKVIDVDEFNEHKAIYGYGKELEEKVFEAVERVKTDIRNENYPFDRKILRQD